MDEAAALWAKQRITVILVSVTIKQNTAYLNFYQGQRLRQAVLRNPDVLQGNLITGTEIEIELFTAANNSYHEAELYINENDFLPEEFCRMLGKQPPLISTFFGLISKPEKEAGRYYMLRDHNADGLLLCTGLYSLKNGRGRCANFDGQWALRYNMFENFFYSPGRDQSDIKKWKHASIPLHQIDEEITIKNLNKKFRDRAAGWHRYNFFSTDDWSQKFYLKQARLGFIAITHFFEDSIKLTPQLQREYAVLDWNNLIVDKKVKKILHSSRMADENIRLQINCNPDEVLTHLTEVWSYSWISDEYKKIITGLAASFRQKKNKRFRIWGVTLSAGADEEVIAGELGYSIGKTYTSLTGFFHRQPRYNNFGKLQMVMLANILKNAGVEFWNLGQPYMEYKLKLGAKVVPRGLFLKRWDKSVRGRAPDLRNFL